MNHPAVNQIERTGYPFPLIHPTTRQLGMCPCGCKEQISTDDAYIKWDEQYFTDRSCLIKYMRNNCELVEVG